MVAFTLKRKGGGRPGYANITPGGDLATAAGSECCQLNIGVGLALECRRELNRPIGNAVWTDPAVAAARAGITSEMRSGQTRQWLLVAAGITMVVIFEPVLSCALREAGVCYAYLLSAA